MQPPSRPVEVPRFIIVMGVSGAGKTTVGQALSVALGWDFYDADHFHPPENVAKMTAGIPLNDNDRHPWLVALHDLIAGCLAKNHPGVLACSALKKRYRQTLYGHLPQVQLVYLRGDFTTILARMDRRSDHYMKPEMLRSQFADLEEPEDALVIDIRQDVPAIVQAILQAYGFTCSGNESS